MATYWDKLAKTNDEKTLLARLRRTKFGKLVERLYAEPGCEGYWEDGDTFASEVLYRVGYEIGHWYQDLEEYAPKYPDDITPKMIHNAEMWLKDAERILKVRERAYF